MAETIASTMFDKIWRRHVVARVSDDTDLLHVDRHLIHDFTSAKAFSDLDAAGRVVRNPELCLGVTDHIVATHPGRHEDSYPEGAPFIRALRRNCLRHGIRLIALDDAAQGIIHVVGPELAFTLPGTVFVCGDSHTCTHGGLGALAFGIGTSDIEQVLATQTIAMRRPKTFRIAISGTLAQGCSAKDLVLYAIARLGAGAGNGYAAEYTGSTVSAMDIDSRLTLCNMSIEWGARIGMVAPDERTYAFLEGRELAPKGPRWDAALAHWRALRTDDEARFDREFAIDAADVAPQVTWGTSPDQCISIDGTVPDPALEPNPERRRTLLRALAYMDLSPGDRLEGLPVHQVFIGSCANSRLSDLAAAADVIRGRKVADGVRALVVPGSSVVKRDAEAQGLDRVFREAGFEWHSSGCSLCAAVNAERVPSGHRCVATSNRNYEGRQGRDARTHLASPAMAAAAAIAGRIVDVRKAIPSP